MLANTIAETMDLRSLAGMEGNCVTFYLGGHKAGAGSRPVNVRLKALLAEAERRLEARGILPTDREALLAPMRARAAEEDMAAGHAAGQAFFCTARGVEEVRIPWAVEDQVAVENRPYLVPLARGAETHPEYFLLALSRENTRMLRCGSLSQTAVDWPAGAPHKLEDFEGFDRAQHTRGQTGAGVKFGFDTFAEKQPNYLHDFYRAIDRALQPLLEKQGLPLVVAGATQDLAVFKTVNSYSRMVPETIEGSPDGGITDAELAAKGRAALKWWRPAEAVRAAEQYQRAGAGKKATEVEAILRAAAEGRVMHLFIAGELPETGNVDRILDRIPPSGSPGEGPDNLANAAAVETWRHDGHVWLGGEPLDGSAIAALFRW